MKLIIQYVVLLLALSISLQAAQARGGVITFTQADGTEFEGVLKGDSSFHWIESDSKVVMYNKSDKFYYNARVNAKGKLELSSNKPALKRVNTSQRTGVNRSSQKIPALDKSIQDALKRMQKAARKGDHPQ